jgi:hypothetical protein
VINLINFIDKFRDIFKELRRIDIVKQINIDFMLSKCSESLSVIFILDVFNALLYTN